MAGSAALAAKMAMKMAAERAPIWVIAIMAHLALAAILGVTYVRREAATPEVAPRSVVAPRVEGQKLDDTVTIEIPRDFGRLPSIDAEDVFGMPAAGNPEAPEGADSGEPLALGGDGGDAAPGPLDFLPGATVRPGAPGASSASRITTLQGRNPRIVRSQPFRPKVEPHLVAGLRWLREHQSDDGAWDCDGFSLRCDPKCLNPCDGAGNAGFDAGVTGLALLAFLGAGYDGLGQTPADEAVRKGLRWLRSVQDAEGCFGPRDDVRFTYAHACATIAMCEAAAFNKGHVWRKSAQAAIDFVQATQNPYRGWRYGVRPGKSDSSVTGWMLLALKAGKDANLVVSDRAIRDGLAFLDAITDEETGRTGYMGRGELPVRPEGLADRWPATESESLTAVAICARIFLGAGEQPLNKLGAALLTAKPPRSGEATGAIDMYYWYYGTLAMHQLGGAAWNRWNEGLEQVIAQSQIRDGCAAGSFDPKDPWGGDGGRVYATALMTLCLEVQWRYPLVFGARK